MEIFEKFKLGFKKSASTFTSGLKDIITKKEIDDKTLSKVEDYLIYSVKQDQEILDATLDKLRKIKKYIDEDRKVPYFPDEKHDWCSYQITCEKEYFLKDI